MRLADCAANAPRKVLKLPTHSPSCCSSTLSAAVSFSLPATSFERSCCSTPPNACLTIAPPSVLPGRRSRSFSAPAQRSDPARPGSVRRSCAAVGLRVRAEPYSASSVCRLAARIGVQRVEDLIELNRIGGLGDRNRVARGDRRRRRRAGLQINEPVAFEQNACADLERRVAVNRQTALCVFPSSPRRCCLRAGSR